MEAYGGGCQICESTTRPLLCASCANRGLLKERWATLAKAQQRKDAVFARLEHLLAEKVGHAGVLAGQKGGISTEAEGSCAARILSHITCTRTVIERDTDREWKGMR